MFRNSHSNLASKQDLFTDGQWIIYSRQFPVRLQGTPTKESWNNIFKWAPLLYEHLSVSQSVSQSHFCLKDVHFFVPPCAFLCPPAVCSFVPPCEFLCPLLCVTVSPPVCYCVPPCAFLCPQPLCVYYSQPNYVVGWGLGAHLPQRCCDFLTLISF